MQDSAMYVFPKTRPSLHSEFRCPWFSRREEVTTNKVLLLLYSRAAHGTQLSWFSLS